MEIDIKTVEYDAELTTENGTSYVLNDVLIKLQWEEQPKELAQKASLTVANFLTGAGYLMSLCKINCIISIYAKWNGGNRTLVFQGTVWEWQYASSTQKELTVLAYDPLVRLQQSKDFKYFISGMDTKAIISNICGDPWNIPHFYKWGQSITHEKKVMSGEKISDMIIGLLDEVHQKTGEKYVVQYRGGKMTIDAIGTNTPVYRFDTLNTISTNNKLTINGLVTQVVVYGKEDKDEKRSVEWTENGELKYGVLREIVLSDSNKTLEAAKADAKTILKDKGKPEETIQIDVPDVPFMRKGDKVEVSAGNLLGFFIITGVTHNATSRQMTLTLERAEEVKQAKTEDSGGVFAITEETAKTEKSGGVFAKGDSVILNGPVYVDSYGNGKGKTFTGYKSTITIVAPLERSCPYHIGSVGWVYPGDIKKG